jgi:hypothetical protein
MANAQDHITTEPTEPTENPETCNPLDYMNSNIPAFMKLVESIYFHQMVSPMSTDVLSTFASIYDSMVNGEIVNYKKGGYLVSFQDHFTDDFWVILLMSHMEKEDPLKVIHLAHIFGKMAFLSDYGPTPFVEQKAAFSVKYEEAHWCNTQIAEETLSALGQQVNENDKTRLLAYQQLLKEYGSDQAVKGMFRGMLPNGLFDTLTFNL